MEIEQADFAVVSVSIEVRSAIPIEYTIKLAITSVKRQVTVQAAGGLFPGNAIGPSRSYSLRLQTSF